VPSSPENQDRWSLIDGKWLLKKYVNKPVAASIEELQARQDAGN
jgi:hypothetical protein